MAVVIGLPLFGPPGREMEEGDILHGRQVRDLAGQLQQRLEQAADTLDRLEAAGWTARVAMYDALLSRPGVETREDAEKSLKALGIAPDDLLIVEEVEDDNETETSPSGAR